jgi:glycine hydroxymethyltransferase
MMSNLMDMAVFPGIQGGLCNILLQQRQSLSEKILLMNLLPTHEMVANAKAMAKAFVDKDYQLISNGTDNHLMLIDLQ